MTETSVIHQTLFRCEHPPITVESAHLGSLSETVVDDFLATATSNIVGMAASYGPKFVLEALAFSTDFNVLCINMGQKARQKKGGKQILRDSILCNTSYQKHGFDVDRIASALHLDLDVPIQNAFDLQHLRHPRRTVAATLGVLSGDKENVLNRANVLAVFHSEKSAQSSRDQLALRAWAGFKASSQPTVRKVPPIDTEALNKLVCS
jgi:regulator of nonsense transcripts 1